MFQISGFHGFKFLIKPASHVIKNFLKFNSLMLNRLNSAKFIDSGFTNIFKSRFKCKKTAKTCI